MLTLTVRAQRSVVVVTPDGEEIIFTVIHTKARDEVVVGIKAPDNMPITREYRWEELIRHDATPSEIP